MTNYLIVLSKPSLEQIEEIADYFDEQYPPRGFEFRVDLADIMIALEQNPKLWQVVSGEIRRAIIRKFNYLVFYRVVDSEVRIISIEHERKNRESFQ